MRERKKTTTEDEADAVLSLLDPLLRAFEMLMFVSRHLHPPDFEQLMASIGAPDEDLEVPSWQVNRNGRERLSGIRAALDAAGDAALQAFSGLRDALGEGGRYPSACTARCVSCQRAWRRLYPLAGILAPVNRFFLDPALRLDDALQELFLRAQGPRQHRRHAVRRGGKGRVLAVCSGELCADRAWPLVMALHGGSGTGRLFLWSWLRDARSRGAILVAPTSVGSTWALMGADADTPNLSRILQFTRSRWNVDATRLAPHRHERRRHVHLRVGLEAGSPFTHLPLDLRRFSSAAGGRRPPPSVRAACPSTLSTAPSTQCSPSSWRGKPTARCQRAGAEVTYREVDDLSHCYPRELNSALLGWLDATPARQAAPRRRIGFTRRWTFEANGTGTDALIVRRVPGLSAALATSS